MSQVLIEVKDLTKVFENKVTAINDISLKFKAGQFYALLGENGAGKSTLMRLLMQNEFPSSGEIFYQGLSIYDLKSSLSYDSLYLDENMPLALNRPLSSWAEIFKLTYPTFKQEVFDKLTRLLNIDITKPIMSLSRGQKVKALFALGSARRPKLYFLDEITAVLDIGSRLNIVKYLEKEITERNCTVIMSSNIATELPVTGTHIFLLKNGQIILDCQGENLSGLFIKYISCSNDEDQQVLSLGGVFLNLNSDGSKSFILHKDKVKKQPVSLKEDQRAISITDAMTYFTSGNGATL